MKQPGYSASFRLGILRKIVAAYDSFMAQHTDGSIMYTPANRQNKQRWYKKNGYDATVALPLTVDEELRQR